MRSILFLSSCLLLLAVGINADFYDSNSGVVNLDSTNFDKLVKKDGQVFLVEFYAPWCGHCKNLTPEWIKAAKQLKGLVHVGAVDADNASNRGLASQYGIRGFPTIKAFVGKKAPVDYNGERSAAAIVNWAKGLIPPANVQKVGAKTVAKFMDLNKKTPGLLLFTDKKETPAMYNSLALKFQTFVTFGVVQNTEKDLVRKYDIANFPTLVFLPVGGKPHTVYGGKIQMKPITRWLARQVPNFVSEDTASIAAEISDQSCFKMHCVDKGLCALLLASGDQKNGANLDILEEVQDARSDSLVHFAWMDVSQEKKAQFIEKAFGLQPQNYPQMVVLSPRKLKFANFVGAFDADNVGTFIKGVLSGRVKSTSVLSPELPELETDTVNCKPKETPKPKAEQPKEKRAGDTSAPPEKFQTVLTAQNFDKLVMGSNAPWVVEFFAPWCGHCKSLAPQWAKAADSVKNMVRFGTVDCTVEESLASRFGIKGFPTIKVFPAGPKSARDVSDYNGAREAKAIANFAFSLLHTRNVEKLTAATFGEWYGKSPQLRHVILFSNKEKISDLFKSVSIEFEERLIFGFVHEDEAELVKQLNIDKFPTILVLDAPANMDKEKGGIQAQKYAGAPNFNELHKFLSVLASAATKAEDLQKDAAPSVKLLTKSAEFKQHCTDKGGICFLALIAPESMAAAGDASYEAVLDKIAAKYHRQPIHFVKADRSLQPALMQEFDLADSTPVSAVILNARGKQFVQFRGAFDEEHISEFTDAIKANKLRVSKYRELPAFADAPAPAAAAGQEKPAASEKTESESGKKEGSCASESEEGQCTAPPKEDL